MDGRRLCQVLIVASLFTHGQARELWKPATGTRDQFFKCGGIDCDVYKRIQQKLRKLMGSADEDTMPSSYLARDDYNTSNGGSDDVGTCPSLFTEEQVDGMTDYSMHHPLNRRRRSLVSGVFHRWTMPIRWKFDGEHTDSERTIIRNAFQHWMDQTCVRFDELVTNEDYTGNHIIVSRSGSGCYSYIGKVNVIPQVINLQPACLKEFGTPVHEIGHALGFWHEQQRPDRDDVITILWDHLNYYKSQYMKRPVLDDFELQYDIDSVMHYGPKAGSNDGVSNTMETRNPLYQHNMGQRVGLSFLNAKAINFAYCNKTCETKLAYPCHHSGYQDPNNCYRCKCPGGFTGSYCADVEPPVNAECGGIVSVTNTPRTIMTPGYESPGYYDNRPQCNWLIKTSPGHRIVMQFEDEFGVYAHNHERCFHWVEVRYGQNLGVPGPRLCGYKLPTVTFTSETDEMMIVFRTNWTVPWSTAKRGFKASFVAESIDGKATHPTVHPTVLPKSMTNPLSTTAHSVESITKSCDRIDITFALDSSGSIGKDGWRKMRDFVKELIGKLTVDSDHVRVSVISFGNEATLHFGLSDHATLEETQAAVEAVPWKDQWTNTAEAMRVMTGEVFQPTNGDRSDAPNVCIVITDGPSNKDRERTVPDAAAAREAGISIFAVGVGPEVDQTELVAITGSSDRVTYLWDFDELSSESTIDAMVKKTCAFVAPTTPPPVDSMQGTSGAPKLDNSIPLISLILAMMFVVMLH